MAVGIHGTSESIAGIARNSNWFPTLRNVRLRPCLAPRAPALGAMIAVALLTAGCNSSSPSRSSSAGGGGLEGAALPAGLHAPRFALRNQQGRAVALGGQHGRVVVLAFLSTRCRACELVAQQVRGALDELRPGGVHTIFVSTDPRSDTPARSERFLDRSSLRGRADFLSGTRAQLQPVWRAYGIAPIQAGKAQSGKATAEAATSVLLIDRDDFERVAFGLEQLTPETLAHDIRALGAS